jgi:hypothetical protein
MRAVNRFKERSLAERRALADIAVTSAAADGRLDVTAIKVLGKETRASLCTERCVRTSSAGVVGRPPRGRDFQRQ